MVKLFLDTASISEMDEMKNEVQGFTTNPSLMRKAGVTDYLGHGKAICDRFRNHSVSLEVIADDFDEMEYQANKLNNCGSNVFVKIPVTNTKGDSSGRLIKKLASEGIKVNVTAVFTKKQINAVVKVLIDSSAPAIISVFAGRIADTGVDPVRIIGYANEISRPHRHIDILWASTRQVFDVHFSAGADIITVSRDILKRMALKEKDLDDYSRETVKQFYDDAKEAGYSI